MSISPPTCNINSSQLSDNVFRYNVYNITDVSDNTSSYVSCNLVNMQSYLPECTVSPCVDSSSENKVVKALISPYQALRYPKTHPGTKAVKKPTSAKFKATSKTKRSGIG